MNFASARSINPLKSMKIKNTLITIGALTSLACGQVTTDVVGYISLGADNGGAAVPTRSDITISIPFVQNAEGVFTVSSFTQNSVTFNESMTAGAFNLPSSGAPFMIEVSSGRDEGIYLEIASNTTDTITLSGFGTDFFSELAVGDTITIRKTWTLATVFDSNLPPGASLLTFDNTGGINNSASSQFIFAGTWFNAATGGNADDTVLYPGESFILRNNSNTAIQELTISGTVPTTESRVTLRKNTAAPQDTRFSYFSPIDETLIESNLSLIASNGDTIFTFNNNNAQRNKSAFNQYRYVEAINTWFDSQGNNANNFPLIAGEGYIYRRSDSGIGDTHIVDEQTYQSNL